MANTVSFAAVARTSGFTGVGFSPTGFMRGSIAALCRNLSPTPKCEERLLYSYLPSQIVEVVDRPHISADSFTTVGNFIIVEVGLVHWPMTSSIKPSVVYVGRWPSKRAIQLLAEHADEDDLFLFREQRH